MANAHPQETKKIPTDQAVAVCDQYPELLRKVLGPVIAIDVTPVTDIPLTAAGKLRVVVRTTPRATSAYPEPTTAANPHG